ncbi:hypothetical protein VTK56DRAFT_8403 [Thermocarpiscus australiensis]
MEFRHVVQSVCRSTAAAARPSLLASTRPSPSAVLRQQHQFSTSRRLLSEAEAVQPQPQHPPPQPQPAQSPVDRLRTSSSQPNQGSLPPRPPPPPPRNNFFIDPQARKPNPAPAQTQTQAQAQAQTQAPNSNETTAAAAEDPYLLPSQIQEDMERSTGHMGTWNPNSFLTRHFDAAPPEPEPRLRPSTGRTVPVRANVDLARAFRLLHKAVATNGLRRDVVMQRAHERPALKRKRLRRERWQKRFKEGFYATLCRARELKDQGW